jgi:uncharacterized membrane protein YcaP (DUF421 family)
MDLLPQAWEGVFAPEVPLLELVVRGTALYFAMLILVRLLPRRTGGELGMMDLIFVLLLAEAATHAMGDYTSLADALIVIATLTIWNFLINVLSYRIPVIEHLVSASAIEVVRNGRLLRRNMRREYLTEAELMSHLREEGIEKLEDVKCAMVESDGRISVIPARK